MLIVVWVWSAIMALGILAIVTTHRK